MISKYLPLVAGLALTGFIAWAMKYGYDTGYQKAKLEAVTNTLEAVERARQEWENQQEKDEEIVREVIKTQIEYRDRERIVYRDIVRWRTPDGCRDLGRDFRLLFNGEAIEPNTTTGAGEFKAAVSALVTAARAASGATGSTPTGSVDRAAGQSTDPYGLPVEPSGID